MAIPVRLLLVAVAAVCGMAVFADSALMTRAHVKPGCTTVRAGTGPALEACHAGWFKGYPNLTPRGCVAVDVAAKLQYWSCPAAAS